MKITHQNVDKWLFDYCEGNLSASDKKQLFAFLDENPEYREDLDAWKESFLSKEAVPVFEGADDLMVSETGVAKKSLTVALLLLLLAGGSAGYLVMTDESSSDGISKGNGFGAVKNKSVALNETNSSSTSRIHQGSYTATFNKKRDALPSSHTPGNLPGIHSPYPVNSSVTQTSHSYVSNASLNSQVVTTTTSESSEFDPSGQEISKNQYASVFNQTEASQEETPSNIDENQAGSARQGDELINAGTDSYIPWQFTRVSDLNPDYLSKLPRDYGQNDLSNEGPKHNVSPARGITTANTYDHEALQPSLFAVQQNASFSGGYRQLEGLTGARARWIGSENSAYEFVAGFQDYKRKWKSAYGFFVNHTSYMEGAINMTSANLFFSPKIKLKSGKYNYIEPSLNIGYSLVSVSPKLFKQEQQLELFAGQVYNTQMDVMRDSKGFLDVKAGVQLQTKHVFAALGLGHLNQPNITFLNNETSNPYRLPMSIDMTIGTDLVSHRNQEFVLSPQLNFIAQGTYSRAWGGAKLRYKNVYTAASASYKGELFAMAGVRTKYGSFAYKFDFTESVLEGRKMMSHGLTASLYLRSFSSRTPGLLDYGIGSKK